MQNPYAPPTSAVQVASGQALPAPTPCWREANVVVVPKNGGALPDRCIKCNAPAAGFVVPSNLSWHTPWAYLTIFLGLLIYIVVALIISKRGTVGIPLCPAHRRLRRNLRLGALASAVGFPVLAGLVVDSSPGAFALCLVAFIFVPLSLLVASNVAHVARIDDQFIRLKAGKPFLDSLG